MILIFAHHADGSRNYLTKAAADFDINAWANEPERRKAFRLLGIIRISYQEV